ACASCSVTTASSWCSPKRRARPGSSLVTRHGAGHTPYERKQIMSNTTRSAELFAEAQRLIPGGVNSPVRAFRGVGGTPRFIARGAGAYLEDADGNRFVDLVLSWGPLSLGHAHPAVVRAIVEAAGRGTSYGAPTEVEIRLAQRIIATFPSVELVRMVNSGTEVVMSAVRLLR